MSFRDYFRDKAAVLLINAAGTLLLFCFLTATGYPVSGSALIILFWGVLLAACFGTDFAERRRYFKELSVLLDSLEERYLAAELMPPSHRMYDRLYREVLRRAGKSALVLKPAV